MTGGRLLGERYLLGPALGRGGMGDVLAARDVRLDREVAVKVLRPELARDPTFQSRFRREAQAAASLDAPGIVSVYDTGEDEDGVPWIVMERVEGVTLRELLQTEGRLRPDRALRVVAEVCAALQAAHTAAIVHRDIKPANVMVTPAGEVKVMDFGIARAVSAATSAVTQTAAVIGTAAYLSPEQARGEPVDARSDLYSAGCLLYELLTGSPPFVADSPIAVAYQHVREDPPAPSTHDASLSPDVDAVVLKAMAKNAANRYQSAGEMQDDLLRAAAGAPVLATPLLPPEPPGSAPLVGARPRRRGARWVLAGLLLAALAVAGYLLVPGVRPSALVRPPHVVGLSQQEAGDQLTRAGLRTGAVHKVFSSRDPGTVVGQSPDQGFLVRRGRGVDLDVSDGVQMATVPALLNLSQPEAQADLAAVSLGVSVVTRDVNRARGTVLEVRPAAGAVVAAGTRVVLVVASGNVQVPDVRSLPADSAERTLQQAGFVTVRQSVVADPVGVVAGETPVNALAARGSTVTLDVSVAPPPSPSPSPTPSPPVSPSPSSSPSSGAGPSASATPSAAAPRP